MGRYLYITWCDVAKVVNITGILKSKNTACKENRTKICMDMRGIGIQRKDLENKEKK